MKYCFIDFEYNGTKEARLNLVSCAYTLSDEKGIRSYWLVGHNYTELTKRLTQLLSEKYVFVAYAVTAEARSMLSMGMEVTKIPFIDLYLEYRCLTNHNNNWMYGKQLIDGVEKTTKPPTGKYSKVKSEFDDSSKPQHSLASACYKVLGIKIDTEHKETIRDIIIYGDSARIEANKSAIIRYNESDIVYLPKLFKGIISEYKRLLKEKPENLKTLHQEMLVRGNYAARTAVMESLGYPLDYVSTRSFASSVPSILWDTQSEINKLFPGISPFRKNRDRSYSWRQKETKQWILEQEFDEWLETDTRQPSLSLEAWKKYFPFSHNYPKDNFGAQMVRYLTLRQQLNGFLQSKTAKKKNNFWDNVGTDERVRPYFGIYGSQSARSQPKATGFLFLKSAWMRALCVPKQGRAICGIDYKSQEFLLAALLSRDAVMLEAYKSGDPYLFLGKEARNIPPEGTKKTHPIERDIFKVVTLSVQYGKGESSLAEDLTLKMGKKCPVTKSRRLINKFHSVFKVHHKWTQEVIEQYQEDKFLKIPCGWYMWKDNKNKRSVGNYPIQGFGSSIMRKAVCLAQDAGLDVIMTLHDAIYIEYNSDELEAIQVLKECMLEAFKFYFPEDQKKDAVVGLDINAWSLDYKDEFKNGIKFQTTYLDERGAEEYEQFSKYFAPEEINI